MCVARWRTVARVFGARIRGLSPSKPSSTWMFANSGMMLSWGQSILQTIDPKDDREVNRSKNEEAVRRFRRSVDLDQNNAQAHLWLAEGLLRSRIEGRDVENEKLKQEACGEYRKALKLDPRLEDARKGMERVSC